MEDKQCIWKSLCLRVMFALLVGHTSSKQCPRDKSRTVASVVHQRLFPVFSKYGTDIKPSCPFSLDQDMYGVQEAKKVLESGSRWTCDICGKSFVSEYFLDHHFDNRHKDHVQTEGSVCLADACDVFRCDIVSGASIPDFWDVALCLEDDMQELAAQCHAMIDLCVPESLTDNETISIKAELQSNLCSFLTCTKYWDTPFEKAENTYVALYVVLAALTAFGILIYEFVFYNYFYSDMVEPYPFEAKRRRHHMTPYPGHRSRPR